MNAHKLIAGISASRAQRIARIVRSTSGFVPALGILVGLAVGAFGGDPAVPAAIVCVLVGFGVAFLRVPTSIALDAWARRQERLERAAGYTTLGTRPVNLDRVDPVTGVIVRPAGQMMPPRGATAGVRTRFSEPRGSAIVGVSTLVVTGAVLVALLIAGVVMVLVGGERSDIGVVLMSVAGGTVMVVGLALLAGRLATRARRRRLERYNLEHGEDVAEAWPNDELRAAFPSLNPRWGAHVFIRFGLDALDLRPQIEPSARDVYILWTSIIGAAVGSTRVTTTFAGSQASREVDAVLLRVRLGERDVDLPLIPSGSVRDKNSFLDRMLARVPLWI